MSGPQAQVAVLPPGTILQQRYLRDRLARLRPGRFVEVGAGDGHTSAFLLSLGWQGTAFEPYLPSAEASTERNRAAVDGGRLEVRAEDFLDAPIEESSVDLVLCSMVLEHLPEPAVQAFFDRSRALLRPGGRAMVLVPGSPRHWGIEDDVAGHLRRYTHDTLAAAAREAAWEVEDLAGLTYPLSNLLLLASNALVRRAEGSKRTLDQQQRTAESGHRDVPFKTTFPSVLGLVLNERTMLPFDRWQRRHRDHPDSLVLFLEASPR